MISYVVKDMLKKTESTEDFSDKKLVILITTEEFDEKITNIPHKKTIMSFLCHPEYTKAQLFGTCIAGTACIPEKDKKIHSGICIGFYITDNRLFLIGDEKNTIPLLGRMKENQFQKDITLCGLFCSLLNLWIDEDIRYLQKTENELIKLEETLSEGIRVDFDDEIRPLRRNMTIFQSYYYQLINLGMTFRSNINRMLSEEDCLNFTYFTSRAERLHVQVQALKDYIVQIRESYQTDIALKQSRTVNFLTVMSAVFLPLTLITGWYGMNFRYMPELSSPLGYPAIIAAAIIIVIIEIMIFRKKNFL